MEEEYKSEGKCLYCNETFDHKGIGRHLSTHLSKMEKENSTTKFETYCHINVKYDILFLHLLVKGTASMYEIDRFLRAIWLECCNHLSDFRNKHADIDIDEAVQNILLPNTKIQYDFDYGTTTTLDLKAHKHYKLPLKDKIILLSRNEPLDILCVECEKNPATDICSICNWQYDAFFCQSCAEVHAEECNEFEDFGRLPVVNSPRMGLCGYMGGSIDRDRDGYIVD